MANENDKNGENSPEIDAENLIKETLREADEAIDHMDEMGNLSEVPADHPAHEAIKQSHRNDFSDHDHKAMESRDGFVDVRVSEDQMSVFADFYPPQGNGKQLSPDYIHSYLEHLGVIYGIKNEIIVESIFDCNTSHKIIHNILIAEGTAASEEIPEHIELDEKVQSNETEGNQKKNTASKQVDYKTHSPFILVEKAQVIGYLRPAVEGQPGTKVTGAPINFSKKKIELIKVGKNIVEEQQDSQMVLKAVCHGRFLQQNNNIQVDEVLEIRGDVDYSTGNVNFRGDIVVHGEVRRGFSIHAGGSIFFKQSLDATDIFVGHNLTVQQGIIGKQSALVRVKGDIETRFIEHCLVDCLGTIDVKSSILNSSVRTKESIRLGKGGSIIGGNVNALHSIETNNLGNTKGRKTEIHLGSDPFEQRKLRWIKDKIISLSMKQQAVKNKINHSGGNNKRLTEALRKIQDALSNMQEEQEKLLTNLQEDPRAHIIVHGSAFPGVYIEICGAEYRVSKVLNKVLIKLAENDAQIVVEQL